MSPYQQAIQAKFVQTFASGSGYNFQTEHNITIFQRHVGKKEL